MTEISAKSYIDGEFLSNGTHKVPTSLLLQVELSGFLNKKNSVKVFPWMRIFQFKSKVASIPELEHLAPSEMKLFVKNIELSDDDKTLLDYSLSPNSVIMVETRRKMEAYQKGAINPYKLFEKGQKKVSKLIHTSSNALEGGCQPKLTVDGTSGAYLIENQKNKKISIFKPFDQEVNAPNNPRNMKAELGSDGICRGILSGECATREVAAYLLDSCGGGFHSVPTTTYVEFYHPSFKNVNEIPESPILTCKENKLDVQGTKNGSLQEFVPSIGMAGDFGSSRFSERQIHKIGILDIRILNCDRNDANILVQQENSDIMKLIPIDHGLSLPDNLIIEEQSIAWMSYPQSKKPFTPSELSFIRNIDPFKDMQMLSEKLGFRQICLRNFRIAEIFLKQAAEHGFTLFEIGKMIYRIEDYDSDNDVYSQTKTKRSELEQIVLQAENLYINVMEENQKENLCTIHESSESQSEDNILTEDTCDSLKSLKLKKKISLPTLKRKNTSFHQRRHEARKTREGVNGVSKTIWNKYSKKEWSELFYHYFEDLCETFLNEKIKNRK